MFRTGYFLAKFRAAKAIITPSHGMKIHHLTCAIIIIMMSPSVASLPFNCVPNATSFSLKGHFSECDLTPKERATVVFNIKINILPIPVFILTEPFYLSYALNVTNLTSFGKDWYGAKLAFAYRLPHYSPIVLDEVTFARIMPHMDLLYNIIASSETHTLFSANNWVNATSPLPHMTVPEMSMFETLLCFITNYYVHYLELRMYSSTSTLMGCIRANLKMTSNEAMTFSRNSACAAPLTIANVNMCTNGGTYTNGTCVCQDGFYGSWCEHACFHGTYVCTKCINETMLYNQTSDMEPCCECDAGYTGHGCSVSTDGPIGNVTVYVGGNLTNDRGLLQYDITTVSHLPAAICEQALHSISIICDIDPYLEQFNLHSRTEFLCVPGNNTYEYTALYQTWPYRIYNISCYYEPSRDSLGKIFIGSTVFRTPEAAPYEPTFRVSTRGSDANLTFTISSADCTGLIREIDVQVVPDTAQSVPNHNHFYNTSYDCLNTTSFNIIVNGLDPGSYRLRARFHTIVPGNWSNLSDEITVPANSLLTTNQVIGVGVGAAVLLCSLLICTGLAIHFRKRFQNLYSVLDRWFPNPIDNSTTNNGTTSYASSFGSTDTSHVSYVQF